MAGTELIPQTLNRIGQAGTFQAITGTGLSTANYFANTGNEQLLVKHASSGGTVYAQITQRVDLELPAPKSAAIAGSTVCIFGPFPVEQYSNTVQIWGSDGNLSAVVVRLM